MKQGFGSCIMFIALEITAPLIESIIIHIVTMCSIIQFSLEVRGLDQEETLQLLKVLTVIGIPFPCLHIIEGLSC
jgi:hypothetical protein